MSEDIIEEIDHLQAQLLRMGKDAAVALANSVSALAERDAALARSVINSDDLIDSMQIVIEDSVAEILSKREAAGSDWRRLIGFVKIAGDLERVADCANNIAEIALELRNDTFIKPLVHTPQLAGIATEMLEDSLKAFIESDEELATAVGRRDDHADATHELIVQEIHELIERSLSPSDSWQAHRLLQISEYLERVADHAANIAEQAIYISSGKRVRF